MRRGSSGAGGVANASNTGNRLSNVMKVCCIVFIGVQIALFLILILYFFIALISGSFNTSDGSPTSSGAFWENNWKLQGPYSKGQYVDSVNQASPKNQRTISRIPSSRRDQCCALSSDRRQTLCFGGYGVRPRNIAETRTPNNTKIPMRKQSASVVSRWSTVVYEFGVLGDLWQWSNQNHQWTELHGGPEAYGGSLNTYEELSLIPAARRDAQCFMDPQGGFWLLGGHTRDDKYPEDPTKEPFQILSDFWYYDTIITKQWYRMDSRMYGVPAISEAAFWVDPELHRFRVFGGLLNTDTMQTSNVMYSWTLPEFFYRNAKEFPRVAENRRYSVAEIQKRRREILEEALPQNHTNLYRSVGLTPVQRSDEAFMSALYSFHNAPQVFPKLVTQKLWSLRWHEHRGKPDTSEERALLGGVQFPDTEPRGRRKAAVWHAYKKGFTKDYFYVYGGQSSTGESLADMWYYDHGQWKLVSSGREFHSAPVVGVHPGPRHAMCAYPVDNVAYFNNLVLLGGERNHGSEVFVDEWRYNVFVKRWQWISGDYRSNVQPFQHPDRRSVQLYPSSSGPSCWSDHRGRRYTGFGESVSMRFPNGTRIIQDNRFHKELRNWVWRRDSQLH